MAHILLNSQTLLARNTEFFGKEEEIAQLLLSLAHDKGSTTLVSGDRGSGKTSLIEKAIKLQGNQLHENLFFTVRMPDFRWLPKKIRNKKIVTLPKRVRYPSVVVRVPLIPANTDPEMLKGIVLRAIIHALVIDRPISGYFLYPITYKYHLRRLKKMVHYKQRSVEKGLHIGGASGGASGTFNRVYKSELDLSDIRIELILASFFRKFAPSVRFVIIFDETDKYEDSKDSINVNPEKLIYHAKNLFTTNGAHFIFVSTENYYYTLRGKILSNTRDSSHTLFTNTILINHMSPEDFLRSLRSKIENYNEVKDNLEYRQFEQAMMWSSNLYPFEQNKQLTELPSFDGRTIELSDIASHYSEYWETYAAMHRLITRIYNRFGKTKDSYYNRYLYRVLREVAELLLNSTSIGPIHRRNLVGTIFYAEELHEEADSPNFFIKPLSRHSQPLTIKPTWKNRIYELSSSELDQIEEAVEELFWRLNRIYCLSIERGEGWNKPINIKVKQRALSFKKVDSVSISATKLTPKEELLLTKYQLAYNRYSNTRWTSAPVPNPPIGAAGVKLADGKWIAKPAAKSRRFLEDIDEEITILKAHESQLKTHLLDLTYAWLKKEYEDGTFPILDLNGDVLTLENSEGKKMFILGDPQTGRTKSLVNKNTKVIALHKFAKRYAAEHRSTYLKKYFLPRDFKGYGVIFNSMQRDVKQYFKV